MNAPGITGDGKVGLSIKIPVEQLRTRKLMLCVPMYGGQCAGMFTRGVADLAGACVQLGIKLQFYFLFNESLITRARNYCCDEFMRSDCTHMLFIDSDIGFNPQDVLAMLALMDDASPYDVMAAPYAKKCIAWEKVKRAVEKGFGDKNPNDLEKFIGDYVFNPKQGAQQIPIGAPVEVLEAGTGFMMIRRAAFDKFRETFPDRMYKPDHVRTAHFDGTRKIMMYFQADIDKTDPAPIYKKAMYQIKSMIEKGETVEYSDFLKIINDAEAIYAEASSKDSLRYLSEDYLFCQDAWKAGLRVWFCPWMKLQHVGSFVFGGSLADLAQLGASATADVSQLAKTPRLK